MSVLGDRIRKRLDAIGQPADSGGQSWLAREVGMKQQGIASILAGDVERPRKLREIATALKTSQEYLLGETSNSAPPPENDIPQFVQVPQISWVAAGDPDTPEAVLEFEEAERLAVVGLDPNGDWIALRVDGSSMNKISPPDSIIFVNRKNRRLTPNACYIIADSDTGKASYKRFRPPNRFEPVTTEIEKHKKSVVVGSPRIIGRVRRSQIDM